MALAILCGILLHLHQLLVCPPQMLPSTPQLVVEKVVLTTEGSVPRLRMREGQASKPLDNHMPWMVDEL